MKQFIFKAWFISQLRKITKKYPPWYNTLNKTKEEYFVPSKTGKSLRRVRYTCQKCQNKFSKDNVVVDHIEPVIPQSGFPMTQEGKEDWNVFIDRLFCGTHNLQVLCKSCHNLKTTCENIVRKSIKKNSKIKKGNNG